jgi:hypothetical protein
MNPNSIYKALVELTGRSQIEIVDPLGFIEGLDKPHSGSIAFQRNPRDMQSDEFGASIPRNVASVVDAYELWKKVRDGEIAINSLPIERGQFWFFYPGIRLDLPRVKSQIRDVVDQDGKPVMINLGDRQVKKTKVTYESYTIRGTGLIGLTLLHALRRIIGMVLS